MHDNVKKPAHGKPRGATGRVSRRAFTVGSAGVLAGLGGLTPGLAIDQTTALADSPGSSGSTPHGHKKDETPTATPPPTPFVGVAGEPLAEPPVRASANGLLETTLEAKLGPATVAGRAVQATVYEGSFPGPTLRIKPGDTLRIKLVNGLTECTNIHTHGFHVSPRENSDNIFLVVNGGETFDYEYKIPDNHTPGTYWYHPHCHGTTGPQCNGGMAGIIIIEGGLDDLDGIKGLTDRLLVLQAPQFNGDGNLVAFDQQSSASRNRLINGQLNPTISIRPGETQRWRIANVSSDDFFLLALAGHQLHQIAKDGNPFDAVVTHDQILLAPAERVDILVQASSQPGNYEFRTLLWGLDYQAEPDQLLATLVVAGDAMTPSPLPTQLIPFEDLSKVAIDRQRTTTFEEPGAPLYLAIDGKHFDPNRIDQTVKLGTTEEWIVRNTSSHWHPFHIHVNDFQMVARDGQPVRAPSWEDTVTLPPNSETTIRARFLDFSGKFVYHCHILSHEDFGMMATVEVVE